MRSTREWPLNLQTHRSLSEFSTFGIGGPIRYFAEIGSIQEAEAAYAWAQEQGFRVLVLGKGSNCLFSDAPFDGLVLLNKIDFCEITGPHIFVGAGYSFSHLGVRTAKLGLSGLEFASGIPATVGGAIYMNAGAGGRETCHPLVSVQYLFEHGEIRTFERRDLSFAYRTSPFQSMSGCILSARFSLELLESARTHQLQMIDYRMKTQPLKEKSAGCIFRNPSKDLSAGALIEKAGLKGLRVADAEVSLIHANFIVNRGAAKADDVRRLITMVQEKVLEQTGTHLETEIRVFA